MRLDILGPLEIRDGQGRHVEVTGRKQRALLATLVVRAGHVVSADRLIAEVWGEHPPTNAANALQAHVRRVRKVFEAACGEPDRIRTRPPGYRLDLRAGENDAAEFVDRSTRARKLAGTDPAAAIPLLRAALALWRGPALEGCVTGDLCAAETVALEEHRITALETLYDASLRVGRHDEVVGELAETSAAYPLRERFYDQLIVALHRGDRQAEAISVYDRARRHLHDTLGVEPGPALRARLRSVLSNTPPEPADPHQLAQVETAVLGRELAELQQRIDTLAERQVALLESLRTLAPQPAE